MTAPVVITAYPATNGRFRAVADGVDLCAETYQPFFDGCRALVSAGESANGIAILRHAGSDTETNSGARTSVGNGISRTGTSLSLSSPLGQ